MVRVMNDESSDGLGGTHYIPAEDYPGPVLQYDIRGKEAIITWTNEAFDSTFDSEITDKSVSYWLETADFNIHGMNREEISSLLVAGHPVKSEIAQETTIGVAQTGSHYCVRSVADTTGEREGGFIVLTDAQSDHTATDEVDWISSVVSHELRNPLDVAQAHLRAARETGDEKHLDKLQQAHDRMQQIIHDVLTLTRGRQSINPSDTVEIGEVADDAWKNVDTDGARLIIGDELPTVEADAERLQRLFENLFRNSVEHAVPDSTTARDDTTATGEGERESGVRIQVGSTDGGFYVGDDGVGIPKDQEQRIFSPGYSSQKQGTGLGLTIVKQIAEAHDWSVRLGSDQTSGAHFEFLLEEHA